jgi:hypothetical protein
LDSQKINKISSSDVTQPLNSNSNSIETKKDPSPSSVNVNDILKNIEIPIDLKRNPAEASKYQMEQLRKKVKKLN